MTRTTTQPASRPADDCEEALFIELYTSMAMAMLEQGCPMDTPLTGLDGLTLGDLVGEEG